jgi:NTP pyrophosphatase (non-canonical NTP hydrolase)
MFEHAIRHLVTSRIALAAAIPKEPGLILSHEMQQELDDINDAIAHLKNAQIGGLSSLVSLVREWGKDKQITGPNAKATPATQFQKLLEEVDEIREGIEKKDQHEIIDGIGDCGVVLILLAELINTRFETCLRAAYDEIKGRTGKMVDGQFVKDR